MINPNLTDELMEEMDGILLFALRGLKRLHKQSYNFSVSKKAAKITQGYMQSLSPIRAFIAEQIEPTQSTNQIRRVKRTAVFNAFQSWAEQENLRNCLYLSKQEFYKKLEAEMKSLGHSCVPKKMTGVRYYAGFRLKEDENERG